MTRETTSPDTAAEATEPAAGDGSADVVSPLIRPRPLRPGDRVAVVAPSGPPNQERLAAGCEILRGWGLDVVVSPHSAERHGEFDYLAGSDAHRAKDLQDAWCDPDVDGVIAACGGYGAQRMVDLVDWQAMRAAAPKVFAGFSDVTVLHEAFARRVGVSTLYGPMVAGKAFVLDDAGRAGLRQALFEPCEDRVLTSRGAAPLGTAPHLAGVARGVTVGGCVSLLSSNIGTPDGRTGLRDGILVIEDVEEEPYRMDRILTQLIRSGWLDGVAGIALGSWVDCGEPQDVRTLMIDRLGGLGVPIVADLGFGHGEAPLTVPLGVPAELDGAAGTLRLL